MYKNKRILALIPARGGSKGLPGKNIRQFAGRPLIAWTIKQALASSYLDKVVVSTDSLKISKIAYKYGAETPFLRPKNLATSSAKTLEVIIHALDFFERKGYRFDLIMLLQPTSPLRKTEDIDKAIRLFFRKDAMAIVSVCPVDHHPFWCNILDKNGGMDNFVKQNMANRNRQMLPECYRINGAIYFAYTDYFLRNRGFIGKKTYAYLMSRQASVDIDTRYDFEFAEFLKSKQKKQPNRSKILRTS